MSRDLFDELSAAVRLHDEWHDDATTKVVIDSARRLVQAVQHQAAVIEHYRQHVTPTDEAVQQILGSQ